MKRSFLRRCAASLALLAFCVFGATCAWAQDEMQEIDNVRILMTTLSGGTARLSGPSAKEDGTVLLRSDRDANFTWEEEIDAAWFDSVINEGEKGGAAPEMRVNFPQVSSMSVPMVAQADENGVTFAAPAQGSTVNVKASFQNVRQYSYVYDTSDGEVPYVAMHGTIEVEVRMTVDRILEYDPLPQNSTEEEMLAYTRGVSGGTWRQIEPVELVYRATYYNSPAGIGVSGADGQPVEPILGEPAGLWLFTGQEDGDNVCTVEFDGRTQNLDAADVPYFSLSVKLYIEVIDWNEATTNAGPVVATATGATVLGLGGSAVANALAQPDALPARRRDEEFPADEPEETPDLPEEDSPEVSVSLYKPFGDLVNTKGAAVDIQITVSGGEGLRWHYLPTAICPGGLKAVVPTVVGTGSESTLVLGLTGAAMKQAHCPVFVTVIAWAVGPDGKVLKASGTTELTLHRGGLEAKRNADGSLEVVSYADGNLNGLAEQRVLKESEYTLVKNGDGTATVQALEKRLGSCVLQDLDKKDEGERT